MGRGWQGVVIEGCSAEVNLVRLHVYLACVGGVRRCVTCVVCEVFYELWKSSHAMGHRDQPRVIMQ